VLHLLPPEVIAPARHGWHVEVPVDGVTGRSAEHFLHALLP
jgi:hypothetical protein